MKDRGHKDGRGSLGKGEGTQNLGADAEQAAREEVKERA